MKFGHAVEALELGDHVARKGWNGKGMFLFRVQGGARMAVAPASIKGVEQFSDAPLPRYRDYEMLPYIAMKTADDKVVPWLASQTDVLSEDWEIV